MATRNFVPRSGSEGQLGTVAKPWGKVIADTLVGSFSGSLSSTGSFGILSVNSSITAGTLSTTNITASGDISASGTIFASRFESAGSSNEVISFNDNLNITGNITASNNISASGDIRADGRIFEKGTSVIDHATAMAIVFGG